MPAPIQVVVAAKPDRLARTDTPSAMSVVVIEEVLSCLLLLLIIGVRERARLPRFRGCRKVAERGRMVGI
jgi:hypothetical protein